MTAAFLSLRRVFTQQPWVYAILIMLIGFAYIVTQYQPAVATREDLAEIRSELDRLRADVAVFDDSISRRLDTLEQTMYGEIAPELKQKQRPIAVPPLLWQRNRDLELRRRVEALERWRLFEHPHGQ